MKTNGGFLVTTIKQLGDRIFERNSRYEEQDGVDKVAADSHDFSYCDSIPLYPPT